MASLAEFLMRNGLDPWPRQPETAFRNPLMEVSREQFSGPFPSLPPLPPRHTIGRDHSRAEPPRVQRDVAETISPTMGAYDAANILGDTYLKAREGNWGGAALNSPLIAAMALPVPGVRRARLDMSPQGKETRALSLGHLPETYYHGTTHHSEANPIRAFHDPADPSGPYATDSHHGRAIYMSSDRADSGRNYMGLGPDLTNRVERRAEQIEHDIPDDIPDTSWLKMKANALAAEGSMPGYWSKDPIKAMAWAQAHDDLVGKNPEGDILSLRTNPRNPVYVGGPADTFFEYRMPDYDVRQSKDGYEVIDPSGASVGKFKDQDAAYDHASELRYTSDPVGSGAKLIEALNSYKGHDAFRGKHGQEAIDRTIGALHEKMLDNEGIKASAFEDAFRVSDASPYFSDYEMSAGQAVQDLYRMMGYDAAVLANADKMFPNMGIAPGARHIALFDPTRVRRTDAKFDPRKVGSADLMAGLAGAAVLPAGVTLADILSQPSPTTSE
jgi:hypothetical protein